MPDSNLESFKIISSFSTLVYFYPVNNIMTLTLSGANQIHVIHANHKLAIYVCFDESIF